MEVSFEEQKANLNYSGRKGIAAFLVSKGYAKNMKSANLFIIIFIIIILSMTFFLLSSRGPASGEIEIPQEELDPNFNPRV